nr:YadA-like family protein [Neisseria sp. 51.81]
MNVKLSKDLKLGNDGSVLIGKTALTGDGLIINDGPILTHDGSGNFKVGAVDADGRARPVKITNIADGTEEGDAVNLKQLTEVKNAAAAAAAAATTSVAAGNENISVEGTPQPNGSMKYTVTMNNNLDLTDKGSLKIGNTVVNNEGITIEGGPVLTQKEVDMAGNRVRNVGNAVDDSDAVNKGQFDKAVKAARTEVEAGTNVSVTQIAGGDGQTVYTVALKDDIQVNKMQAHELAVPAVTDSEQATQVTVGKQGINAGGTRITGVGDGMAASDAVNKAQLDDVFKKLYGTAQNLEREIIRNRKRHDGGIASVAAMANIPQVIRPGASGFGVSIGARGDQQALAAGYSRTSDNGKHIVKGSFSIDTQGQATGAVGYLFSW